MKKRIIHALLIAMAAIAAVAVCVIVAFTATSKPDGAENAPVADNNGTHGNVNGYDKEEPDNAQPDNAQPDDEPTDEATDEPADDGKDENGTGTEPPQEPVHLHSAVHNGKNAPSCTADGNVEYWYCEGCGKYFCDEKCENEIGANDIAVEATGHTPVTDKAVAATCTDKGLTEGSHCSVCGEVLTPQSETPLLKHAYTDGICTGCGEWQVSAGLSFEKTDGGYAVSGLGGCTAINIRIPDIYEGEPVIKISETAFFEEDKISGIYIPSSVAAIEDFAFASCTALARVYIEDGPTEIGDNAFYGCTSLKTVRLPETLTALKSVFVNCESLEEIVIPASVGTVHSSAFDGCLSLKRVTISKGLEKIEYMAFAGCPCVEILFRGTPDDWQAIKKEDGWINGTDNYTVSYID